MQAKLATRLNLIEAPTEPTDAMLLAMANERARQERANGHARWGFRDLYIAAISAIAAQDATP